MATAVTSERGMTMVELLVGSAVMITVLSVTTAILTQSSRMFTQQRTAMDTRNSAGASIDMLVRLMRQSSCISDKDVYCQSIFPDPDNNDVLDTVRVRGDWNPRDGDYGDDYEDVIFRVVNNTLMKMEPSDQGVLVEFGDGVQSIRFAYTNQNGVAMTVANAKARPDLITGVTMTVVSIPPQGLVPVTSASTISLRRKK
jgi:type II secretory pathway pseudopilin PulG